MELVSLPLPSSSETAWAAKSAVMRGRKPLLSPLRDGPLSKHVFWSWPELTLVLTRPGAEVDGVWDTFHPSGFYDLWRPGGRVSTSGTEGRLVRFIRVTNQSPD